VGVAAEAIAAAAAGVACVALPLQQIITAITDARCQLRFDYHCFLMLYSIFSLHGVHVLQSYSPLVEMMGDK